MTRLLVAGGSPAAHVELRTVAQRENWELDFIDGARAPRPAQIRAAVARADIVVIWASTLLPHKVSTLLKQPGCRGKTITVARRGVTAVRDAVHTRMAGDLLR